VSHTQNCYKVGTLKVKTYRMSDIVLVVTVVLSLVVTVALSLVVVVA